MRKNISSAAPEPVHNVICLARPAMSYIIIFIYSNGQLPAGVCIYSTR